MKTRGRSVHAPVNVRWWESVPPPPPWVKDAACAVEPPPVPLTHFFAVNNARAMVRAKMLCLECPVRMECLNQYLREKHGIYGGLDPTERHRIVDAVRKGRKISDVLIRVDKKIQDRARVLKIRPPILAKGQDSCTP